MRKLIYAINLTADGCCDHTKGLADDELHNFYTNLIRNAGLLAYGRITYRLMVPYWPDVARNPEGHPESDVEFARAFDSVEKLVFSKTLDKVEDPKTRIIRTSPEAEIVKLKHEQGKDIYLGGVALPAYLIKRNLVDEFIFVIHPVIAGEGRRLFEDSALREKLALKLVDSKLLKSGSIVLHYRNKDRK